MLKPIDAQFGPACRFLIEIGRHRDKARDHRLIAAQRDRVAAVDRHDRSAGAAREVGQQAAGDDQRLKYQ